MRDEREPDYSVEQGEEEGDDAVNFVELGSEQAKLEKACHRARQRLAVALSSLPLAMRLLADCLYGCSFDKHKGRRAWETALYACTGNIFLLRSVVYFKGQEQGRWVELSLRSASDTPLVQCVMGENDGADPSARPLLLANEDDDQLPGMFKLSCIRDKAVLEAIPHLLFGPDAASFCSPLKALEILLIAALADEGQSYRGQESLRR